MVLRVTLLTSNNKHLPPNVSKEDMEKAAKIAWQKVLNTLSIGNDAACVEKCELIER